jgi:hypothetical protein
VIFSAVGEPIVTRAATTDSCLAAPSVCARSNAPSRTAISDRSWSSVISRPFRAAICRAMSSALAMVPRLSSVESLSENHPTFSSTGYLLHWAYSPVCVRQSRANAPFKWTSRCDRTRSRARRDTPSAQRCWRLRVSQSFIVGVDPVAVMTEERHLGNLTQRARTARARLPRFFRRQSWPQGSRP